MATARFVQTGNAIDYAPDSDVSAGDVVVQNDLVGVAKLDIKADALGALAVTGVFDFPKATGGGTAIDAGLDVYWDAAAGEATTDEGSGSVNKKIGRSVADAGDSDATVRVRMSQ
jgi:predicted RecA/RadA family phage recombinase